MEREVICPVSMGPVEPRKVWFPVPPVSTSQWEQEDWDKWIEKYGVAEPLVRKTAWGTFHAVGRDHRGELLYRLNTDGDL